MKKQTNMDLNLNDQEVKFLENLLSEEYIKEAESGETQRMQTHLMIAYKILTKLQNNN